MERTVLLSIQCPVCSEVCRGAGEALLPGSALPVIVLTETGTEADPAHPSFLLPAKTSCP